MWVYKFEYWKKGKLIRIIEITQRSVADAVSELSKSYLGVFRLIGKVRIR